MRIEKIDVIAIRASRKEVVRSATGVNTVSASEFGVVRVVADNGCEGLGEISITFPQVGFSLCHAARHWLAPKLLGLDPLAWGIYQKSPAEMAADAAAGIANGFHAIKLKVGRKLEDDVAAVRAVTE